MSRIRRPSIVKRTWVAPAASASAHLRSARYPLRPSVLAVHRPPAGVTRIALPPGTVQFAVSGPPTDTPSIHTCDDSPGPQMFGSSTGLADVGAANAHSNQSAA